jgi:hypothetical protein
MELPTLGTELFVRSDGWTDRQTDMTKLIAGFGSFAYSSKKSVN